MAAHRASRLLKLASNLSCLQYPNSVAYILLTALASSRATSTDINALARCVILRRINDSLLDVSCQIEECLLHVDVCLCRYLHERYAKLIC